jgi:hypothetical protein
MLNKQLKEQIALESRGMSNDIQVLQKRVQDSTENEKRLLVEIEEHKNYQEKRQHELLKHQDREKELQKQKVSDYENKFKEAEGKRQNLMFELEREKTKWAMERDNIEN